NSIVGGLAAQTFVLRRKLYECQNPGRPIRQKQMIARSKLKAGPKTRAWAAARRRLKAECEAKGITRCQAGYPGCWGDRALSFAHARKRRHLRPGELEQAALVCVPCHQILERLPADEMYRIVMQLITMVADG